MLDTSINKWTKEDWLMWLLLNCVTCYYYRSREDWWTVGTNLRNQNGIHGPNQIRNCIEIAHQNADRNCKWQTFEALERLDKSKNQLPSLTLTSFINMGKKSVTWHTSVFDFLFFVGIWNPWYAIDSLFRWRIALWSLARCWRYCHHKTGLQIRLSQSTFLLCFWVMKAIPLCSRVQNFKWLCLCSPLWNCWKKCWRTLKTRVTSPRVWWNIKSHCDIIIRSRLPIQDKIQTSLLYQTFFQSHMSITHLSPLICCNNSLLQWNMIVYSIPWGWCSEQGKNKLPFRMSFPCYFSIGENSSFSFLNGLKYSSFWWLIDFQMKFSNLFSEC